MSPEWQHGSIKERKTSILQNNIPVKNEVCRISDSEEINRKQVMINLFTSGDSLIQIAEKVGLSYYTVKAYLWKWGCRRNKYVSLEDKQQIKNLYEEGLSTRKISAIIGKSANTVQKVLKRESRIRNISDAKRKYHVNHDYFSEIDSEDKAYFLGFFYADGYNYRNPRDTSITLTLAEKDISVLECLRSKICPEKPFYINYRNQRNPNWQNSVSLKINSKQLSDDLAKWGCTQAKTFNLIFPENLPREMYSHFIRGYFDGDGYASKNRFELVGTEEFLLKVQNIFIEELGLGKTKLHTRHKERKNNIRTLIYGGKNVMHKLHQYLYQDTNYFLERKKSVFN